ncbi:Flp pilus assembly protein CpaB [Streptomyces solicathayae]|uniref:Flp pilus assembly protein CpaB n=1 Tax=Streptomyces solicathayae TaxID=3081768 RepID=A0ABZ0LSP3_9ACTN|nr:Flp pilus assembly protein CpaB [Streptomyces sp. HUAS YS2]WOX22365.1 Flp pilus assembly protein CpaB [Streptomyces sp. HUAS YS2]
MNSRQRRGVVLLLLSVLCAFAAFAGVLSVISDVNSKVGPEVTAYRLKTDIAAYSKLTPAQFEKVKMPKRWLSSTAVTDISVIDQKTAVTGLRRGSLLQEDMIVQRPALENGQQEIAIMIDAATGVAGKITQGSLVNIYATFAGDELGKGKPSESRIIVVNAKVLDVGQLTALEPTKEDRNQAANAVPITFALNTLDAQRVAYAESFAANLRLALVAKGSPTTLRPGDDKYTLQEDASR